MLNIRKSPHKKKIIAAAVVVLLLAGAGTAYAIFGSDHPSDSKNSPEVYNPNTVRPDSNVPKSDDNSSGITQSKGEQDTKASPGSNNNVTPAKPVGTFVSNHHPNLDGNPAPNTENSTCSTTPGAKCQIRFSRNGVVKHLPVKQTTRNGNAKWIWKLQDIGLTSGTWTITAVSINGNKTASSQDATKLVVAP